MAAHRNNVEISVQAQNWPILGQIETDKSLRVMAFCSSDPGTMRQDISFPHQSEIKVNGGDVKANLRGLKNKPGSTRPVDLTPYLRLKPSQYPNKIEMTYALTTKASSDLSRASYPSDSSRCSTLCYYSRPARPLPFANIQPRPSTSWFPSSKPLQLRNCGRKSKMERSYPKSRLSTKVSSE